MENASRALIIAGGILLGVMILSMFLYVFRAAAKTNENYDERQSQQQLQKYNQQFEVYNRKNNTIIDLITVINLAYNTNIMYDYDSKESIEIIVEMGSKKYLLPNKKVLDEEQKPVNIGKNRILDGTSLHISNAKSIYDLINKPLKDLGISDYSENDKLSLCRLGTWTDSKGNSAADNTTIYKYLFKCEDEHNQVGIEYHPDSKRVSSMKFKLYYNTFYGD